MLQPPNPSPGVSCRHKGLVLLLCLPSILWDTHGAGQGRLGVPPVQGTWDITSLLSPLADSGPGWQMLDMPTTPWGCPQTCHLLPPAAIPGASHSAGGGTSGLRGARLGLTPLGPSHLHRGAPGPGVSWPWLPQPGRSRGAPRLQLPPPRPGSLHALPSCACE